MRSITQQDSFQVVPLHPFDFGYFMHRLFSGQEVKLELLAPMFLAGTSSLKFKWPCPSSSPSAPLLKKTPILSMSFEPSYFLELYNLRSSIHSFNTRFQPFDLYFLLHCFLQQILRHLSFLLLEYLPISILQSSPLKQNIRFLIN